MVLWSIVPVLIASGLILGAWVDPARAETATVVRVIDGDTLVVENLGIEFRVRVLNVDTPEREDKEGRPECLYEEATSTTEALVPPGTVVTLTHDFEKEDRYGRILAHVKNSEGQDLGIELTRRGLAAPIRVGRNGAGYGAIEDAYDEAQAEKRGLFDPKIECTAPHKANAAEQAASQATALEAGFTTGSAEKALAKADKLVAKVDNLQAWYEADTFARFAMRRAFVDAKYASRFEKAAKKASAVRTRMSDLVWEFEKKQFSAPSTGGGSGGNFDVPDFLCPTRFC